VTTYYKLTDSDGYTRRGKSGETLWKVGEIVSPTGEGSAPCGSGVLHFYKSPEEAVLYDPIHAEYGQTARLFAIEINDPEGKYIKSDGLKCWTTRSVRVVRELPLPRISIDLRVAWAICIAPDCVTRRWAVAWLSGRDRSEKSAAAVASEWIASWSARGAAEAAWAMAFGLAMAAEQHVAVTAIRVWRRLRRDADVRWPAVQAQHFLAQAVTAIRAAADVSGDFHSRALRALARARAILAGEFPAEQYDDPLNDA
jgi:hypothetical protein